MLILASLHVDVIAPILTYLIVIKEMVKEILTGSANSGELFIRGRNYQIW